MDSSVLICYPMSIDELLRKFRNILVPRIIFYSCLTLKTSAVRSSECLYPFTSQRHPYVLVHIEGKEVTQNLSADDATESSVCCMERQNDECRNKYRPNKDAIAAVAQSLEFKWGGLVTRMDQHRKALVVNVRRKNRRKENWATETRWADTFKSAVGH